MTISTIARIATAALLAGGTMNASAGTSSPAEQRGYDRCVQNTARDSLGLVAARRYQIQSSEGGREYFINATRWESGERANVRINCQTTRNGRRLVSLDVMPGRYVDGTGRVRIEVAGN